MATSIWENFGRYPWCSQTQHATHITRKKTHSTWHGLHIKKRAHTQNLQANIYTPPYTHTLKLAHNSKLLNTHTTCIKLNTGSTWYKTFGVRRGVERGDWCEIYAWMQVFWVSQGYVLSFPLSSPLQIITLPQPNTALVSLLSSFSMCSTVFHPFTSPCTTHQALNECTRFYFEIHPTTITKEVYMFALCVFFVCVCVSVWESL